ncbi:glycosyltransferase family 2 protein [Thiorhodospira sibirica]|uniref:glycosyltransferase family 2 protein n=1 Tax=Thiorhodospira sibirica TaxID=154347 RepID=UPI001FEC2ADC|nr:glycosyltransferase family 2 protein [Thiorhodospira sibirica]
MSISVLPSEPMPSSLPADLAIIIPAYNEQEAVAEVVRAACGLSQRVIVVDDGSQDATATVAREAGAIVLSLTLQLGAWGATQTGIRYALAQGCAYVVTLDADGQHEPAFVPNLLKPMLTGQADVVIGACPARVSPLRRLAWRYFKLLTGLAIEDLTSGFRAYNHKAMQLLASKEASLLDYQDVGVLMLLRRRRLRIEEVPVTMWPRLKGASRVFPSWWVVLKYMLESSVLCIADIGRHRRDKTS